MYVQSKTAKTQLTTATTLALFDFDGTLCQQDSFTGFMSFVLSKPVLYRKCLKIFPQIAAYYSRIYPAHQMRPLLYKTLLSGKNSKIIQQLGQQYALSLYQHHLNDRVLEQLHWHKQQQHRVVIVSASLDLYLQPLAELLNIELICTQVEQQQYLSGKYLSPDCSCEEKVTRVKQLFDLDTYCHIYAYGNSKEDYAMLNCATQAFWVNSQFQIKAYQQKQST